jgi:polyketide cyclase/dehydrase/lipid transport protein
MKTFDVQSIGIEAPRDRVFEFVAEPGNLPKWANVFKSADNRSARLQTPQGTAAIALRTDARRDAGTIDWTMTLPDGSVGTAYARVTPDVESKSAFSFVLMAPPVPLEAVEGALDAQRKILTEELVRLKAILEAR